MNRRHFLMRSAAAAVSMKAASANDMVRVACVGIRGQGNSHIHQYSKMPNVEIAALCDVDEDVLNKRLGEVENSGKKRPVSYTDVRKLLEDKSIDVISIATPNHWHSLIGIWACQAGKDAYIEKPISHNVWEGRQLVKAAAKHGRIVQGGTQSRSDGRLRHAVRWVHEGNLGKIRAVYGMCYKPRMSIGKVGHGEIPAGLDYDIWCGPAPKKPLARKNL